MASYHLVRRRAVIVPVWRSVFHTNAVLLIRSLSTTPPKVSDNGHTAHAEAVTASLDPRWLSDLKKRIGKCVMFGLKPVQVQEAASILKEIARDWRELVAGSEGFLTGRRRRGLHRQNVVWGEMEARLADGLWIVQDSMWITFKKGHVNNVTYIRYAESARINWAQNFAIHIDPAHKREWSELWTPKGDGLILRSIKTDFKFPMTWPDHISVYHKLRSSPSASTDSFILDVVILSELHQRPAARCIEDIVVYDYRQGKKTPLRPFMLERFRETYALQEQAQEENSTRIKTLLDQVRSLETSSWDMPDAREDSGSPFQ
ncbi:MAG: hypothetical protein M1830_002239 [Pleopsidium flavum]|nr:MAG: hypothetical protein M1830_002239 [Pleopsidium flavum]